MYKEKKRNWKVLGSLTIVWLVIAGIYYIASLFGWVTETDFYVAFAGFRSALVAPWLTIMILTWVVEYNCSLNNVTSQLVEKYFVTKIIDPNAGVSTYLNFGMKLIYRVIIYFFWIVIALFQKSLPEQTANSVKMEFLKIGTIVKYVLGEPGESAGTAWYLMLTASCIVLVIVLIYQLFDNSAEALRGNEEKHKNTKALGIVTAILLAFTRFYSYVFFSYPANEILWDLLFWGVIIGLGVLIWKKIIVPMIQAATP